MQNSGQISVDISGTTDDFGIITRNVSVPSGTTTAYCISNISDNLQTPWNVTVSFLRSTSIDFRVRKMSDNSVVANTAVSFSTLVIFD